MERIFLIQYQLNFPVNKFKAVPIFITSLIFIFSSSLTIDKVLVPKFTALSLFLLVFSLYILFSKKKSVVTNWLFISFLIFIIYSAITLIYSINVSDGIFEVLKIVLLFSVYFLFSVYYSDSELLIKHFTRSFSTILIIAFIIASYELLKTINLTGISHQNMYNVKSVFANKNIFSEILLLLLPVSVYVIFFEKPLFKTIGVINFILSLFFITILLSRAVWVSFFAGIILSTLFILLFLRKKVQSTLFTNLKYSKLIISILSIISILTISVFVYSKQDTFSTFVKQTSSFTNFNKIKKEDRVQLWIKSIDLIKEKPLLGHGIASWKIEILKYGNKNLSSENNTTFYQRPHNDYLWILAEQGIIGLLLYLSIFTLIFFQIIKAIRNIKSKDKLVFMLLALWMITSYMLISMFSFPKERIEHLILLGITITIISLEQKDKTTKGKISTNRIILLFIPFLVLSTLVGAERIKGEFYLKKAMAARTLGNYTLVRKNIDDAYSFFYKIDPFSTPIIWYKAEAFFMQENIDAAYTNFKLAYKQNPNHIHVLNNLATCFYLKNKNDKAIELYKKSIKIAPNFEEALLNISASYYNIKQFDSAFFYFSIIDTNCTLSRYTQFQIPVLRAKTILIFKQETDTFRKKVLFEISNSSKWQKDLFLKSKKNNISFYKQIMLDVDYVINTDSLNF